MSEHPIRLAVGDDLRRSRLTVLVRALLAYPHFWWSGIWFFAVVFATIAQWFYALATGRPANGLHGFNARFTRYHAHVQAYIRLVANPYPHFVGDRGDYPVDLEVDPPAPQRRWTVALRLILGVPAFVLTYVFGIVGLILALVSWFICLILGRMPEGVRNLAAYLLRFETQTYAYLLLVTDRYPSLSAPEARTTVIERPAESWAATYI